MGYQWSHRLAHSRSLSCRVASGKCQGVGSKTYGQSWQGFFVAFEPKVPAHFSNCQVTPLATSLMAFSKIADISPLGPAEGSMQNHALGFKLF